MFSTLTWLFKRVSLSFKQNRRYLLLNKDDMNLRWPPAALYSPPDAVSGLPCSKPQGENINEAFLNDTRSH